MKKEYRIYFNKAISSNSNTVIIELISVPIMLNEIEESKEKSSLNSTYGLIDAAKLHYIKKVNSSSIPFNTDILSDLKLTAKKPDDGYIILENLYIKLLNIK